MKSFDMAKAGRNTERSQYTLSQLNKTRAIQKALLEADEKSYGEKTGIWAERARGEAVVASMAGKRQQRDGTNI